MPDTLALSTTTSAAQQCPLCGSGNACAVANGLAAAQCWCMHTAIAPAAVQQAAALRPAGAAPTQCICQACGSVVPALSSPAKVDTAEATRIANAPLGS